MGIMSVPESLLSKAGLKKPKLVLYGTLAVVGGVLLFVVVKRIKRALEGTPKFDITDMSGQISDISINPDNLTITQGEANIISNNLLAAMNKYGTDEAAIIDNLESLQTKADLMLVVRTFGIKLYDGFGLAVDWVSRNFIATPKGLQGWLRAELSGSTLKKVKEIFDGFGVAF